MSAMPAPAIVITGASSGIGRAFALSAPEPSLPIVLVARSVQDLERVADELRAQVRATGRERAVNVVPLDLQAPNAGSDLESALAARGLYCDILVNNAGIGLNGEAARMPLDAQMAIVDLNVRAATELALRFLPDMVERGRGGLLNVASIASYMPGPYMALYYASKAYMRSLSEALWQETRGTGVHVTCLAPGPVKTPFFKHSGEPRLFKMLPKEDPDETARTGWAAFARNQRIVVPSLVGKLTAWTGRLTPHALLLPFLGRVQRDRT